MSNIAKALNPLAPFHLGMTPLGDFHRQKMESELFKTPLSFMAGQVIILCNADTTLFRNPAASTNRYNPAEDLDYWVNMRVYLYSTERGFGITALPESGTTPSAVLMSLNTVATMSAANRDALAVTNKSRFTIAMPDPMKNPVVGDLTNLLKAGINLVPLDIFSDTLDITKGLVAAYNSESWHSKPPALQLPNPSA